MSGLLLASVSVVAGAVVGTLYFVLLYRSVQLHATGAGVTRVLPLHIFRVALAVSSFWIIAQQGAGSLVFALSGFLIARLLVQRRLGVV